MRRLLLLLLLPPLLIVLLLLCGLVMALEDLPLVTGESRASVEDAVKVRRLARKGQRILTGAGESAHLEVTEEELNGVMALAARGRDRFSGRVRLGEMGMVSAMTFRMPDNPVGDYLNLQVMIPPSREGLEMGDVRLGRLEISGRVALVLLRTALDLGLGRGEGRALLASVTAVDFAPGGARLHLSDLPRLRKSMTFPLGTGAADPAIVHLYLERLRQSSRREKVSLAAYLQPLFRLARERSVSADPVAENRAALLALATYLGHPRFSHLVGPLPPPGQKTPKPKATLAGRKDLRLHFVVSAGLKLVSDQGLSYAVGEAKELLDAGRGGSGFSFVDLAADRAGVRFATVATDSARALRLQDLLAGGAEESAFFPPVPDLPEDLTQAEFEERFGDVGSPAYQELVREIDARLDQCPAYAPL